VKGKRDAMFSGEHVNMTEDRAALHTALRASRKQVVKDEGKNVVPEVWQVLDKIRKFSNQVRRRRRDVPQATMVRSGSCASAGSAADPASNLAPQSCSCITMRQASTATSGGARARRCAAASGSATRARPSRTSCASASAARTWVHSSCTPRSARTSPR
jgi:Phosphoglucose isomerase